MIGVSEEASGVVAMSTLEILYELDKRGVIDVSEPQKGGNYEIRRAQMLRMGIEDYREKSREELERMLENDIMEKATEKNERRSSFTPTDLEKSRLGLVDDPGEPGCKPWWPHLFVKRFPVWVR